MWDFVSGLLVSSISAAAILGFVGLIFRDTILKYVSGRINTRFDKEIEVAKSEIRQKERDFEAKFALREKNLERTAEFLSQMKREQSAILLKKKIDAAEATLKACAVLSRLTMAVETLKIMKTEKVYKEISDPKLQSVFKLYVKTIKIEEKLTE